MNNNHHPNPYHYCYHNHHHIITITHHQYSTIFELFTSLLIKHHKKFHMIFYGKILSCKRFSIRKIFYAKQTPPKKQLCSKKKRQHAVLKNIQRFSRKYSDVVRYTMSTDIKRGLS